MKVHKEIKIISDFLSNNEVENVKDFENRKRFNNLIKHLYDRYVILNV